MVLKSGIYMATRVLEILTTLVIVGIMGYFVNPYVKNHAVVPDQLLCLFIVSILAAAWSLVTLFSHRWARAISLITAIVDVAFVGAFIASVVLLRAVSKTNCINLHLPISITVGSHTAGNSSYSSSANKNCTLLKVAWSLAIANCILFAVTAWAAYSLHKEWKGGNVTVVHKEHRRSSSSSRGHRHSRHRTYV